MSQDLLMYFLMFQNACLINANIRTAKYLAVITLGFFIAISPWTLCTLIIVAAKIHLNETVDYMVTWLCLSNSFWNCLIYGVMNRKFRMAAARFACGRWFSSLGESVTSKGDDSKIHSEDLSSAYSKYKMRQTQNASHGNSHHYNLDGTVTSSAASTPIMTPLNTPRGSPCIAKKTVSYQTDIL